MDHAVSDALASKLSLWTFEMVQERMVEAVRIWWRTPGRVGPSKGSPFASDIPAELITRDLHAGDYDALGIDRSANDTPIRSAAMTRVEVAKRDHASDWMAYVPERDRRLVSLALVQLAQGDDGARVSWMRLKQDMGVSIGAGGLQRRYERAIAIIAGALNEGVERVELG